MRYRPRPPSTSTGPSWAKAGGSSPPTAMALRALPDGGRCHRHRDDAALPDSPSAPSRRSGSRSPPSPRPARMCVSPAAPWSTSTASKRRRSTRWSRRARPRGWRTVVGTPDAVYRRTSDPAQPAEIAGPVREIRSLRAVDLRETLIIAPFTELHDAESHAIARLGCGWPRPRRASLHQRWTPCCSPSPLPRQTKVRRCGRSASRGGIDPRGSGRLRGRRGGYPHVRSSGHGGSDGRRPRAGQGASATRHRNGRRSTASPPPSGRSGAARSMPDGAG